MGKRALTADQVSTSAKLAGVPPALALAIWDQESGSGSNAKTSGKGATGDFQMMPATFQQFDPTGDINDPVDNMHAALGYMGSLLKRYNGDWEKVAQAYYHGSALPPGASGPTSGPGTPDTRTYGQQVMARAKKLDPSPSLENLATAPAAATSTDKSDLFGASALPEPSRGAPPGRAQAQSGPWVDPIWNQFQTGASASPEQTGAPPMQLGDMGPPSQLASYGGPTDAAAFQQGSNGYDLDSFVRKLVDDIV